MGTTTTPPPRPQDMVVDLLRHKKCPLQKGADTNIALTEISHAKAIIGVIMDSMMGTEEEGTDRYNALWAASCALSNADALLCHKMMNAGGWSVNASLDLNNEDTLEGMLKAALEATGASGFAIDAMTMEADRIEGALVALEVCFSGETQPARHYVASALNGISGQVATLRRLIILAHQEHARVLQERAK